MRQERMANGGWQIGRRMCCEGLGGPGAKRHKVKHVHFVRMGGTDASREQGPSALGRGDGTVRERRLPPDGLRGTLRAERDET